MNIHLTGGAGYIGSHTIIELDKAGHSVVVVDKLGGKYGIVEMCRDSWNWQKNNPNGY